MKIKIKTEQFGFTSGQIVDATVSDNKNAVTFLPGTESYYWLASGSFEIIEEKQSKDVNFSQSLRDLVGQDMNRIEFK